MARVLTDVPAELRRPPPPARGARAVVAAPPGPVGWGGGHGAPWSPYVGGDAPGTDRGAGAWWCRCMVIVMHGGALYGVCMMHVVHRVCVRTVYTCMRTGAQVHIVHVHGAYCVQVHAHGCILYKCILHVHGVHVHIVHAHTHNMHTQYARVHAWRCRA